MSQEPQAPHSEKVAYFSGVCSECGTKTGAMKTLEPSGGTKGIYVRCECGQINRCFR